jgi:hypothetical protein
MTIRTQLKAGRINLRKRNVLAVRSGLKAGGRRTFPTETI